MRTLVLYPLKAIGLLCCYLMISFSSHGKEVPVSSQRLDAGQVQPDAFFSNHEAFWQDNTIPANPANVRLGDYTVKEVRDIITLGIDHDLHKYMPQEFECGVRIRVRYMDIGHQVDSLDTTLTVSWKPGAGQQHCDKKVLLLSGGHYVDIKVLSVSDQAYANYLYLQSDIEVEHFARISETTPPAVSSVTLLDKDQLEVVWTAVDSAEEYDLEWLFVDDYKDTLSYKAASELTYGFEDSASRVTVQTNRYRISNVFEHGYVLFRIRAVGRDLLSFKQRINGPWSSDGLADNKISNFPSQARYHITSGHENTFNWQYSASYSEEGKRSEMIGYFDGSLKNRQSVTLNYTDSTALVSETIYDHQGRPALQVLPTPDTLGIMKYYPDFNLNTSYLPYSRADFDKGTLECANTLGAMSDTSGASQYYSSNNPILGSVAGAVNYFHQYTPTAEGYPFVLTEYTADNTGRVRRQSGVGEDMNLASGREMRYYYGKPDQPELDRLFGNNVGHAEHYQKNMVIDPNGQVSVSYVNARGQVIATALAGTHAESMDPLASNTGTVRVYSDLLAETSEVEGFATLSTSRKVLVSTDSSFYSFDYSIEGEQFSATCLPEDICYDCVYDLTISIRDECGQELLFGHKDSINPTPIRRTIGKPLAYFDTICRQNPLEYTFDTDADLNLGTDTTIILYLNKGEYTLTKTLSINQEALDFYTEEYVSHDSCLLTYEDFLNDALANTDFSGCGMSCQECVQRLGVRDSFIAEQMERFTMAGITPAASDSLEAGLEYDSLRTECEEPCRIPDICEIGFQSMVADVSPGGQYALFEAVENDSGDIVFRSGDETSLLNLDATVNFSQSAILQNETITIEGQEYTVSNVGTDTFVRYWKPRWAHALVQLHPEYCQYEWCDSLRYSNEYDMEMMMTESYDTALARGYFAPMTHDPYFLTGGTGVSQSGTMTNILNDYLNNGSSVYNEPGISGSISLQNIIAASFKCRGYSDADTFKSCADTASLTNMSCSPYRDYAWNMYRAIYLAEKRGLQKTLRTDVLGYNCNPTIPTGKAPRYPDLAETLTDSGFAISPSQHSSMTVKNNVKIVQYGGGDSECEKKCESYADYWMFKLEGCNLSSSDSIALRAELINICIYGCDKHNPWGSSNVAPDFVNDTNVINASFKEAIRNIATYAPGICDEYLISFPMPYGHDYFATQNPYADTCTCHETAFSETRCENISYSFTPGSWELQKYATTDTLEGVNSNCACKENPDEVDIAVLISQDDVPQDHKCEKCITCDSLRTLTCEFYTAYGYDSAQMDTTPVFREIFQTYLNNRLSFNLVYDDYLAFMEGCTDTLRGLDAVKEFRKCNAEPFSPFSFSSLMDGSEPEPDPNDTFTHRLDTCACNALMQIYRDSVLTSDTRTLEEIYLVTYGKQFPGLRRRLEKCQKAFEQQNTDIFPDVGGWEEVSSYALFMFTDEDPTLTAPDEITCTEDIEDGPGDDPYTVNCVDVISVLRHFQDNLQDHPDYYTYLQDSLNQRFGDSSIYPLTYYLSIARECRFGSSECFSDGSGSKYCNYKPTQELLNLLDFLNHIAADTNVIKDKLKLHSTYSEYYNSQNLLYDDTCYYYLKKYVDDIADVMDPREEGMWMNWKIQDSCDHLAGMHLSFSSMRYNYNNMPYYHNFYNITHFSNIRPVPDDFGDTAHSFLVDVTYRLPDGTTTTKSLAGYSKEIPSGYPYFCDRLCNEPMYLEAQPDTGGCRQWLTEIAENNAKVAYNNYLDSVKRAFRQAYVEKCMSNIRQRERFTMERDENQYHYTLYYYDMAGNLIQTVPPAGVQPITDPEDLADVRAARENPLLTPVLPSHTLVTTYHYNTLNQLVYQETPDAGESNFWYDRLGRLVVSRNARQVPEDKYSYTEFDFLGRITEVGEVETTTAMTIALARDDEDLGNWIAAGTREQITRTYYDVQQFTVLYNGFSQDNLRSRVVSTTYQESEGSAYDFATHYSYDIHGNVYSLVQQYSELADIGQNFKMMTYDYDLVSGNVNELVYQPGKADQFIHRYNYDADNRLTEVATSREGVAWDRDARYYYHYHGPMGRMEIGERKVQGMDYAYTIHGWLKGVNSNTLKADRDMGHDGMEGGLHPWTGRDAFGYTLGYYTEDYQPVGNDRSFEAATGGSLLADMGPDLYNGNIRHMVTAIGKLMPGTDPEPLARGFRYDQLNRLIEVQATKSIDMTNNNWQTSGTGSVLPYYYEHFSYDANGNILEVRRTGDTLWGGDALMDSLDYEYYTGTNRLKRVRDYGNDAWYEDDLNDQSASTNYTYDAIGNLVSDASEEIENISWTVYGKVREVQRTTSSSKAHLKFAYGSDGNRVMKLVKRGSSTADWRYTWYVRDAQGNVMAVYERAFRQQDTILRDSMVLKELDIYGSSRVGMLKPEQVVVKRYGTGSVDSSGEVSMTNITLDSTYALETTLFCHMAGQRQYELSNHLGNVLATVSDRLLQVQDAMQPDSVDYFEADVLTARDYYAFGAEMPRRKWDVEVTESYDSCVTCGQLRQAVQDYVALYDTSALSDTVQFASYIDSTFEFSRSWASYKVNLRECKIMNIGYVHHYSGTGANRGGFLMGTDSLYAPDTLDFTIEAWVNVDSTLTQNDRFKAILCRKVTDGSGQIHGYSFSIYYNEIRVQVWEDNAHYGELHSDVLLNYNQWYHIAISKVGKNVNDWVLYIDGQPVSFTTVKNTLQTGDADANAAIDLGVGRCQAFAEKEVFTGIMREVRMYKGRALDSAGIAQSYNNGCGADPGDTSNLILWCRMDEGVGNDIHDISPFMKTGSRATADPIYWEWWLVDSACVNDAQIAFCETIQVPSRLTYRYGFNGMEKEDEVSGEGNSYTAEYWQYDPRLGRRWNVDPVVRPWESPYATFSNNPILLIDPYGNSPDSFNRGSDILLYTNESYIPPSGSYNKPDDEFNWYNYKLDPTYSKDGNLLGYTAYNRETNEAEWTLGADKLAHFTKKHEMYSELAKIASSGFNGTKNYLNATSYSSKFDWGLYWYSLGQQWGDALTDPYYVVGVASAYAAAYPMRGAVRRMGHSTPYAQMTAAERKAFQHSYTRHHAELGLPNWKHTQAEHLRVLFNKRVAEIRQAGAGNFFKSNELVHGVKKTVYRTEPVINGQRYYYYETLEGTFVSVGKMP